MGQYNLPLWCSCLCVSVWILVWFISIWRCICTVRGQGNRKGSLQMYPVAAGFLVKHHSASRITCVKWPISLRWLAGCAKCRWKVCKVVLKDIQLQFNGHNLRFSLCSQIASTNSSLHFSTQTGSSYHLQNWLDWNWMSPNPAVHPCLCRWTNSATVSWEKVLILCMT